MIGAGVFGAWVARELRRAGKSVVLLDAYGAANSRSSSGGESRVLRLGYGADEIYTRWSLRSLVLWLELFAETGETLFHRTGVLWMAREGDAYSLSTVATLRKLGVPFETLQRSDLEGRYPQIAFGPATWGILEPASGALMARRAVERVVQEACRAGVDYRQEAVPPPTVPSGRRRLDCVTTLGGVRIAAETFVFACGPWLPKLFPDLLQGRIRPTRQEVFFFGVGPGEPRFAPPRMPVWVDFGADFYGIPDLENRGFKVAFDRHGPAFDPDTGERTASREVLARARAFLAERFPALREAPLLESRVCQYENTSNGDFLIDRHPGCDNLWLVGGGSGHGFKHGPALGEYVAARTLDGGALEPRFTLASKGTAAQRAVF